MITLTVIQCVAEVELLEYVHMEILINIPYIV